MAKEILGRWAPWPRPYEILVGFSQGNPRAMARIGNPFPYQPWKSEGCGAYGKSLLALAMEIIGLWRAWESRLLATSHGNQRAMVRMRNPSRDQPWKSEGDGTHGKSLSRSNVEIGCHSCEIRQGNVGHHTPAAAWAKANVYKYFRQI